MKSANLRPIMNVSDVAKVEELSEFPHHAATADISLSERKKNLQI